MRNAFRHFAALAGLLLASASARANPVLQYQADLHGDMTIIGNTLGQECNGAPVGLLTGRVGACGTAGTLTDSSPDVYWIDAQPDGGGPLADLSVTPTQARTGSVLSLPNGATVAYARLYWAALRATATADAGTVADPDVVFTQPNGASSTLVADKNVPLFYNDGNGMKFYYQSSKDVTALVNQTGAGLYKVSGVSSLDFRNLTENTAFAGWSLVVVYKLASDPLRDITIFEGLDPISGTSSSTATISGFRVPDAGFDAKLYVVAYEGDNSITGDQLFFDGLVNGNPPATRNPLLDYTGGSTNNFFDGSRASLGAGASNAGDLPRFTGQPGSVTGLDIDVVDVSSHVAQGQTSANMRATTNGDTYFFGVVGASISTYKPVFSDFTKSAADLTPHPNDPPGTVRAGDVIEYTLSGSNSGNDSSVQTVITDNLPAGLTFVPGSLQIASGANAGAKTDATGDDQADRSGATITFRVGTGADAVNGGTLAVGEGFSLKFRATVDANASGTLLNQASISFSGQKGAPTFSWPSSGVGGQFAPTPTPVDVANTPAPVITDPTAGALVRSKRPTFDGTGEEGDTVTVSESGVTLCTATVTGGAWSCQAGSDLAEGSNTVQATQTSGNSTSAPASRTFSVDSVGPTVSFGSGPATFTSASTASFTFTASDPAPGSGVVGLSCQLDGDPPYACTSPQNLSNIGVGPHTFTVTATDAAGNTGSASYSWTRQTTGPTVTITSGPSDPSNQTAGSIAFTATDPSGITGVTCTLDGVVTANCSSPFGYANLGEGQHTFTVTATDAANNSSSASITWTVDLTPPALSVTRPSEGGSVGPTPTFSGTSDPSNAGQTVTVTVGASSCTATVQADGSWSCQLTTPLTDGPAQATVTVADAAGNTTTVVVDLNVDSVAPPTPSITSGPSGPTGNSSPTFAFTDSESGVSYLCSLDGVTYVACPDPASYSNLPDGSYTFSVEAVDAAGNTSAPATRSFSVDTTPPAPPSITSPLDQGSHEPGFSGSAEPGSTVTVTIDGATACTATAQADGSWSCTSSVSVSDGSHVVSATATDAQGNGSAATSGTLIIDTVPPDTTITAHPAADSSSAAASFTFTSNETGATYQCALDGQPFAACPDPTSLSNLPPGQHTFEVRAVDAAGNVDPTPAVYTWTVDTTPPTAPSVDRPELGESVPTSTPTFSGLGEPGTTVTVSESGGGPVLCTATVDATGHWSCVSGTPLADGSQSVDVSATDGAGNTTGPTTVTFTVDTQAPTTSIVSGPDATTAATTAAFTFASDEAGVSYVCTLDSGTPVDCGDPAQFSGLGAGAHHLRVQARDAAGNLDPTGATWDWTIDPSTTTLAVDSPAPGSVTSDPQPTVAGTAPTGDTVTVTVTDASGNPVSTCAGLTVTDGTWSCPTGAPLPDGSYTVTVTATDGSGQTTSTSTTFTEDHTAPDTTLTTEPNAVSGSSTAVFGYSSSEGGSTFLCSLDGAAFTPCPASVSYSNLSDGSHTFQVEAVDAAGNVDGTPASYTWTVEGGVPTAPTLTSPGNGGSTSDTTPTFTGTAAPGETVTVSVDGQVVCTATADAAGNWSCTASAPLSEGGHATTVTATDGSGQTSTPLDTTFTVDTTAPETFFVTTPPRNATSTSAPFSFGSNEPNVTYECSLDGAPFAPCSDPALFTGLADGAHNLQVRAVDAAGNRDGSPASFDWSIASGGELVTLDNPTNGSTLATGTPTFSGTAPAGSTVTVSVDGQVVCTATADASGNWSCSGSGTIADGVHGIEVVAEASGSAVGSVDGAFWVDTVAPDTFIVSGPAPVTASTDATFELASDESGVTYECSLDGAAFVPCSDPAIFSDVGNGTHTLDVRARDAAGNVDPSPARYSWTVDVVATTTGSSGSSGSTSSGSTSSGSTSSGSTSSGSSSGTAGTTGASGTTGTTGTTGASGTTGTTGTTGVSGTTGANGTSGTGGSGSSGEGGSSGAPHVDASSGSLAGGGCGSGGSGLSLLALGFGLALLGRRRR